MTEDVREQTTIRWFGQPWGMDPRLEVERPGDITCGIAGDCLHDGVFRGQIRGVRIPALGRREDPQLQFTYYHLDCFTQVIGI